MNSLASFHTAISTHWPSWSHAPFAMWLAEVADGDRPIDRRDDLGELDPGRVAGEDVAAADAALRTDQPGTLEGQEDLFEVWLGQAGALGDVADGRRAGVVGVQGEREQRRGTHSLHGSTRAHGQSRAAGLR